ncbi:unnamed protein product [Phaedon cochleariae]|uniref:Uncharacterized protein n=1 Tax=Phaedon cochleariae TaxID=80249 RepID=A0A9P0GSY8_PHACE|nr:unnamed protein product [Phaedon cochleariae]
MSSRTVLVLLAVNVLLVQSKPATLENGAPSSTGSEEQNLDSLIQRLQMHPTSSNVVQAQAQVSSAAANNQHVALNELLRNQNFVEKLVEFLQRFQQVYQILLNGQPGSQNASPIPNLPLPTNLNQASVRGLFNNPSFMNFLDGLLHNSQGSTFFSQFLGNQASPVASQIQQVAPSQSHVTTTQFTSSQQTSSSQSGVNNLPANPTSSNNVATVVSNTVVNNAAPSIVEHQESSNVASSDQQEVFVNGHSRPVIAAVPQNTAFNAESSVVVSESHTSSNAAPVAGTVANNPAPSESAATGSFGNEGIQTEEQAPALDARFGNAPRDIKQIIITEVDSDSSTRPVGPSSQTSNGQNFVVSSSSGSSDEQSVHSNEATLDKLLGFGNNVAAVAPQSDVVSHSSSSYHSVQSSQVSGNGIPPVQVPLVQNIATSSSNDQQQILNSLQQQASNSQTFASGSNEAVHTSEALLEELQNNHFDVKPVVPDQSSSSFHSVQSSQSSQFNGKPQVTGTGPFVASGSPLKPYHEDEAESRRQAQNARYQFATQVNDNINGNFQQRAEVREGTKVYGKYSYDDGFVWRTVYYQADENGYRVTKEEVSPTHMTKSVNGDANVQTFSDGNVVNYHITRKDIGTKKQTQYGYGVGRSQ